jgi:hypothetical protein
VVIVDKRCSECGVEIAGRKYTCSLDCKKVRRNRLEFEERRFREDLISIDGKSVPKMVFFNGVTYAHLYPRYDVIKGVLVVTCRSSKTKERDISTETLFTIKKKKACLKNTYRQAISRLVRHGFLEVVD